MNAEVPSGLGYRMPAEWGDHEGTWIAWPKNVLSFPEDILPSAESAYAEIIKALFGNEIVHVLVDSDEYEKRATKILAQHGVIEDEEKIEFHEIPTADVWFRDYGPIFVMREVDHNRDVALTHWGFNAWGNKYDDLLMDANIPDQLPLGSMRRFKAPMILEGGSIDVNGLGTCLTTEQCLLNRNRNPQLGRKKIEKNLSEYLGVTNPIWLKEGIVGDDTDGHVDDLARFVNADTVLCAVEENSEDENYMALRSNLEILEGSVDQDGKKLKVDKLPMPGRVEYHGQRLPASYANFYIANNVVLVPVFRDRNDAKALEVIGRHFPYRKVVGIDSRALVAGFGAIHCMTQQEPS